MSRKTTTVRLTELSIEIWERNRDRLNGISQTQFINGLIANYGDVLWLKVEPPTVQYLKR